MLDQGGVVTLPARRGGEIALRHRPRMHIEFGTGFAPLLRKLGKWVVVPEAVSRCRASIDRTHRSSGPRRRGVASLTRILDAVVRAEEVSAVADPPAPIPPGLRAEAPCHWLRQADADAGRGQPGDPTTDARAAVRRLRRAVGAPRRERAAPAKSGGLPRAGGRVCRDAPVPGARHRAPGLPRPVRPESCRAARGGARTGPGGPRCPAPRGRPRRLPPSPPNPIARDFAPRPRPAPTGGQRVCRHGGGVAPSGCPARRPRAPRAAPVRAPSPTPVAAASTPPPTGRTSRRGGSPARCAGRAGAPTTPWPSAPSPRRRPNSSTPAACRHARGRARQSSSGSQSSPTGSVSIRRSPTGPQPRSRRRCCCAVPAPSRNLSV